SNPACISRKTSKSLGNGASEMKLPHRNARWSLPVARASRSNASRRSANTWHRGVAVPKRSRISCRVAVCTPGGRNPFGNRTGKLMRSPGQDTHSCSLLVVVFQEPTKPFVASDGTRMLLAVMSRRHEDHIALHLMGTFLVKMRRVFSECTAERALAKQ